PNASGGDLAASTFGGWIRYSSPDRAALRAHRAEHGLVSALNCSQWAGSGVRRISPPASLRLLVGWTGSPASTEHLVKRVHTPGQAKPKPFTSFAAESHSLVDDLVAACDDDDDAAALDTIRSARTLLQRLGESPGSLIETEALRNLSAIAESHRAPAKPSGARRGDCGIRLTRPAPLPAEPTPPGWPTASGTSASARTKRKARSMSSETPSPRAARKDDHVRLASAQQTEGPRRSDFDDLEFVHHALSGTSPETVDLSVDLGDWT